MDSWVSHDGLPAYGSREHPITFSPTPSPPSPPYDANAQVEGDIKLPIPNPNRRDRLKDMKFGPYSPLIDSDSDAIEPTASDDEDDDRKATGFPASSSISFRRPHTQPNDQPRETTLAGPAMGFQASSSISFRRPNNQPNNQPGERTLAPFVWDASSQGNLTAPSAATRGSTATTHTAAELDMGLSPVADNRHTLNTTSRNEFSLPVPVATLRPGKAVKSNSGERIGHRPLMLRPTAGSLSTTRLRRTTGSASPLLSSTALQLQSSLASALAAALAASSAAAPPPPSIQSRPTSRPVVEITPGKTWWVPGWCAGPDGKPMRISSEGR
ncbi:hypothetical protein MBM_09290 [Drepanopeziza brunnea f. sp. 'multigermtubi' MB_m1]|uniref:Uncharacterized protein n=1 Tax=Marssonina brunnea f. sp. multigermtubi (strain MB_m1) TaxID=1072389 RepID=K1XJC4_MARBU|nr:uncharacterized protein MBM_09290 [Drepanopeziza brunnea f. sp. 'multigermtubi' MB_m1]EKD12534.1 hypothetical protein MBM_09290 [Drepanopeziza brunnea f. sp. 'multigermtubi' MB_m1]